MSVRQALKHKPRKKLLFQDPEVAQSACCSEGYLDRSHARGRRTAALCMTDRSRTAQLRSNRSATRSCSTASGLCAAHKLLPLRAGRRAVSQRWTLYIWRSADCLSAALARAGAGAPQCKSARCIRSAHCPTTTTCADDDARAACQPRGAPADSCLGALRHA